MIAVCGLISPGPKIELGEPCSAGEVCKDSNALCTDGTCQCRPNSYDVPSDRSCGKLTNFESCSHISIHKHSYLKLLQKLWHI